ncbi:MAG TPA: ABC transporter ATP-binding protein [Bryobacteraceae bacterium]|jgi:ABC-2 type transport system ATP-binding protein
MLEVRDLTKRYNRIPAVDSVSFRIAPGEILGYLGPNGAGKSTTVKVLIGLIEPTSGEILFRGRDVRQNWPGFLGSVGYVPEEPHLYPQLSGREYLQLVGRLRGLKRAVLEARMDAMLRLFALWEDRHTPLSSYSKGMRQKILLSAALLGNPEVLILDEPFSGLDVNTAIMLRTLIRALADQGKMILYSSHVLEVVEKICSSVIILRKGKVVAHDRVERLRDLMSQPSLEGVFTQLTEQEHPERVVSGILAAISAA